MKLLLEKQMDELQRWFDRLYGPRGHKLEIFTKQNVQKQREEYILDLHVHRGPSQSLPFAVPFNMLEDIDMRVRIKDRWVGEMQKKIMEIVK